MIRARHSLSRLLAAALVPGQCLIPFSAARAGGVPGADHAVTATHDAPSRGVLPRGGADAAEETVAPHGEGLHDALRVPPGDLLRRPAIATGEVDTKRFRIVYTKRSEGTARELATRIEAIRDDFQKVLGRDWPGTTEIRIGLGRAEMEALALPGGKPPRWAEALAYPSFNVVLLDGMSLVKPEGGVTLRHELSHVALGQLARQWPHWFQEGMAMYLTGDRFSIAQYSAMFRAVTTQRLFLFDTLSDGWPNHPSDVEIAYAQSVTFVTWMVDEYGPDKMGAFIDQVHGGTPFETAYAIAFHSTLSVDETGWRKTLPNRYSWTPIVTGGGVFWSLMSVLTVGAWVRRRRDRARKMEALAQQEAAEDAAERLALALQALPPPEDAEAQVSSDAPLADGVPWEDAPADVEPSEAPERAADSDELPQGASDAEADPEREEDSDERSPPLDDKSRRTLH